MSGAIDLEMARLARRQHGLWTRRQALAAGASGSLVDRRIRSGAWLRLDSAVYGSPAAPATWERSVMAAVLAEGVAAASRGTAAVLHGLEGFRPGVPHIAIPPGAHARGRLSIAHRSITMPTTTVDHIPCVTIEHVFIELAQCVSIDRLAKALARRADRQPSILDGVRERYLELAPRGGRDLRRLRTVLERFGAGHGIVASELERAARRVFERPGLPLIVWEAPFPGRETGACRVDGLVQDHGIVLELDGRAWHARLDDFERDRRRDQAAAAAGLLTLRFTYAQVVNEPDRCVEILCEAAARRSTSMVRAG